MAPSSSSSWVKAMLAAALFVSGASDSFGGDGLAKAFPDVNFADLPTNPIDVRRMTDGNGDGLVKAFADVDDADLPTTPIDMRLTPDGSKWWVLGLMGQIVEIDKANPTGTTLVMDILSKGLMSYTLSFTFSPGFHSTGVFYASYITVDDEQMGYNRLSKFAYDGNSATTLASEVELITSSMKATSAIPSGWIGFKPSAYSSSSDTATHELFWAMGDPGDTTNNGQNASTLRGSIMRIVVNSQMDSSYSVPGSNPFSGGGGSPEICAQGFRNPWKCSFDRETDELFCGDVGQESVETVKRVVCGNNYGWGRFEGDRCNEGYLPESCEVDVDREPYTSPIFNYCHPDYYPEDELKHLVPSNDFCGDRSVIGDAVIGGFVYRGTKYDALLGGNYIFADFALSRLYNLYPNDSGGYGHGTVRADDFIQVSGFAEDHDGEIYVIQFSGSIYELPRPAETCPGGIEGINANDVVCCPLSCGECAGAGCKSRPGGSAECCGGGVKASDVYCDESGSAPCIIGSRPTTETCPGGIEGINASDVVCCPLSCGECAGAGCSSRPGGSAECCGGGVKASDVYCDESGSAPCIIGSRPTRK